LARLDDLLLNALAYLLGYAPDMERVSPEKMDPTSNGEQLPMRKRVNLRYKPLPWLSRCWLLLLSSTFLFGVLVIVVINVIIAQRENFNREIAAKEIATRIATKVENQVLSDIKFAKIISAQMNSETDALSRTQWLAACAASQSLSSVGSYDYAPHINEANRMNYVKETSLYWNEQFGTNSTYEIRNSSGSISPETDIYFPLEMHFPEWTSPNDQINLDLSTVKRQHKAFLLSIRTKEIVITPPDYILEEQKLGVFVISPLQNPDSGVIRAKYFTTDLITTAFEGISADDFCTYVFDLGPSKIIDPRRAKYTILLYAGCFYSDGITNLTPNPKDFLTSSGEFDSKGYSDQYGLLVQEAQAEKKCAFAFYNRINFGYRSWYVLTCAPQNFYPYKFSNLFASIFIFLGFLTVVGSSCFVLRSRYYTSKMMDAAQLEAHTRIMRYMCHEMRNPVHAITQLVKDIEPANKESAERLLLMQGCAENLYDLANSFLDDRSLTQVTLTRRPVVIAAVLRDVFNRFRILNAHRKSLEWRLSIGEDVAIMTVSVDPVRVRQIFANAISNAAKYTAKGSIHVQLSAVTNLEQQAQNLAKIPSIKSGDSTGLSSKVNLKCCFPSQGRRTQSLEKRNSAQASAILSSLRSISGQKILKLEVTDTGPGLGKSESLFSGTEANNANKTIYDGSLHAGLGLLITKNIINLMHGYVALRNRNDGVQGAQFVAVLPMEQCDPILSESYHPPIQTVKKAPVDIPRNDPLENIRIFACEDDLVNTLILKRMLGIRADDSRKGSSRVFADGLDLLQFFDESPEEEYPDIVLMDIVMIHSSGVDILKQMRERGIQMPVLAVTGNSAKESVEYFFSCGFYDVVTKPFTKEKLVGSIAKAIADSQVSVRIG